MLVLCRTSGKYAAHTHAHTNTETWAGSETLACSTNWFRMQAIVFNCKYFHTHLTPRTNKQAHVKWEREREIESVRARAGGSELDKDRDSAAWRALIFAWRCWNYTNCNLFVLQTKTKAEIAFSRPPAPPSPAVPPASAHWLICLAFCAFLFAFNW